MFLTQDKSDVIHSVTENITNIDATTKQNRAIRLAVNKNILSIFTPIKSRVALEYKTSVKFQTCYFYYYIFDLLVGLEGLEPSTKGL